MPQHAQNALPQNAAQDRFVAIAGDAVEYDSGVLQAQLVAREAVHKSGDGLALVPGIDDQQHRHLQQMGEVGGRAFGAEGTVEQAHDALDDDEVGVTGCFFKDRRNLAAAHGPRVEIVAGPARSRFVKAGIDIVRSSLGGGDSDAAVPQCPNQTQGDQCFPAPRGRRRDDDGLSQSGSPARVPCTSPATAASRRHGRRRRWPGSAGCSPPRRRRLLRAWSRLPADAASRHWKEW